MPAAQLLATFVSLRPSASMLNPPALFASARITFDVDRLVSAAQSPNGAHAAITFRLVVLGAAGYTLAGIAQGRAYTGVIRVAATGLAQQFNPRQAGLYSYLGADPTMRGPKARVFIPPAMLGMPTVMAAGVGWSSPPIDAMGFTSVCYAMTSSAAGVLQLSRYADPACTALLGSASTTSLSAATAGNISLNDGAPWSGFIVGFTNTSVSTATLSSAVLMLMGG